jgi:hypothetical protein
MDKELKQFLDDVEATPKQRGEFEEWMKRYQEWYGFRANDYDYAWEWDKYTSTQIGVEEV